MYRQILVVVNEGVPAWWWPKAWRLRARKRVALEGMERSTARLD